MSINLGCFRVGAVVMSSLMLASCVQRPNIRVSSARFLQTTTVVSDDSGNQVFGVGYLLLTIVSDTDLAAYAATYGANFWYSAETSGSHVKMEGWPYLYALGPSSYQILLAYKSRKEPLYNLATQPEDVCIKVRIGSMNPLINPNSKVSSYSLGEPLRKELRAYELASGTVEFHLSAECEARSCRPKYTKQQ
jgi:hypothetical protein